MGGEWQRVAVSDIAEPVLGGTPAKAKPEYWEGGTIPWATAKDIASTNGRFIYGTEKRITWQGLANSAAKLLPLGTIVITARGTVGAIARLGREMTFNQTCYGLVPRGDDISADYLYYALNATLAEARALTYGTVFETITKKTFDSWNIPLPPLTEQRCIARILGTLDDKIELNRRMNETLEAMAQALFKSWFVDFDPVVVNALKAGNPVPDKFADRAAHYRENLERLGLPEEILRLFPDRFVDSELGPIPEGWEVKALDEIAHFQNGLALQKYRPSPGEARLPVVKIAQLRSGRADSDEWASAYIRKECILENGDVVFSWSGSLMVKVWCGGRAALNQHLFKVTSKQYPKWFFYEWIRHHLQRFILIASDKATTMGHIRRHHLSEAKCAVSTETILNVADKLLGKMFKRQVDNEMESRTLAFLRDTLLPKLISGELRVPDVEKILEDAL
ncbi:restriction endonuclease subunit S [Zoogloea sp.]|uniref:restriction endonuclease subunit S n=1 Tax=Zoogloea sp. TaxID=49181 RepID=UPI002BDB07A5|nr:restriction endonuclease subunit S [Zoogloea sp.]HOB43631.1 restriction endonuclease subunit S [Bacillota bacterium]HQA10838.1 restriction endonuclease subunit S [Zoogloea sp.]